VKRDKESKERKKGKEIEGMRERERCPQLTLSMEILNKRTWSTRSCPI